MTASTEFNDNPLLVSDGLPPFDRIRPEHVVPAVRQVLARAEEELQSIENSVRPTWAATIEALDRIGLPFQYAWGPVSHLTGVKNSPELREAHEEVLGEMVSFGLRVSQSEPIYNALKELKASPEWRTLDEAQRRIIDDRLLDAELAGIALQGTERERFNEISRELSQLSTDFSNHVLDATKAFELVLEEPADVEGMPPSLLQLASQSFNSANKESGRQGTPEDGPWRFTLDFPSYGPFMQHCRRSDLREKMYRAFITRASSGELNNEPLILTILRLRREQAGMLGYANYAAMSLAEKMAPDVSAVVELLEQLRKAAWKPAERDLEDLKSLARESGVTEKLWNWDIAFWSERLREKRFDFTDEQLRPYFPFERVLDGLFSLAERLFGIKVTPADGQAPVWNDDVRYFHVAGENGRQIAAFYLDPYSRPENKKPGAWMDDCLVRRRLGGKLQLPVAHLVCNSTPPVGDKPSLMTFREVETLFHEFGHGLQHMLTTVDYADAAGINGIEWDAVELPSQFMENWCYHRPTLLGMTAHYETGEQLPIELFEKICQARTFQSGWMTLRQILFGLTDIELHSSYDPDSGTSPFELQRKIAEKTSVLPMLPEDRSLCAFSHIFAGGYAAGYYSYKWAEVLSADAFSAFEEAGLDDETAVARIGRRFRDTVLSLGGGRHPMQVFEDFRGRQPTPDALLRHNGLA